MARTLNVTSPALATTNDEVNTASNDDSVPTPACSPLPWATMVPAKLPTPSVVTSVNGRVVGPTPEML